MLPLTLSKVFLSASWWDHNEPDLKFEGIDGTENAENPAHRRTQNVHEMLVGGSDSAGLIFSLRGGERVFAGLFIEYLLTAGAA